VTVTGAISRYLGGGCGPVGEGIHCIGRSVIWFFFYQMCNEERGHI
jgi:hypothetical protein